MLFFKVLYPANDGVSKFKAANWTEAQEIIQKYEPCKSVKQITKQEYENLNESGVG